MKQSSPYVVGIIPARYASTRFPGKMLQKIHGKTLIQRTFESASRCSELDDILIATDDERIYEHVESFGGRVVMTSAGCPTGTDRIAEAVRKTSSIPSDAIIINVQGDEPCIPSAIIAAVAAPLKADRNLLMSTAAVPLDDLEAENNPSTVKCVVGLQGQALYFSRAAIPYARHGRTSGQLLRHIGIYGFQREFLLRYAELPSTPLQLIEDLEMLRALENGYKIHVAIVNQTTVDVNTIEDLKKVEQFLCSQNISL